jgi:hypothetical protein
MKTHRDNIKITIFTNRPEKIILYQAHIAQNNQAIKSNSIYSQDKKKLK